MGYVAVQGGITAIENSQKLNRYLRLRGESAPLSVAQIMEQMGPLVDRVMSEGSLYSPFHAALALKQASGDPIEASFLVRAYRSTLRRMVDSLPVRTEQMRILRRISSAFKTIPGGQVLGSTSDYEQRILDFSLADETAETQRSTVEDFEAATRESAGLPGAGPLEPERFRKVVDILREQHLVSPLPAGNPSPPTDITQESAAFPLDRSGRLQMLARAETGGVLALAYSSMRGYGSVHPNVAELRVGRVMVRDSAPLSKGGDDHPGLDRGDRGGDRCFRPAVRRGRDAGLQPGVRCLLRPQRGKGNFHGGAGPRNEVLFAPRAGRGP